MVKENSQHSVIVISCNLWSNSIY